MADVAVFSKEAVTVRERKGASPISVTIKLIQEYGGNKTETVLNFQSSPP